MTSPYSPVTTPRLALHEGERHLHTFRVRGYRYGIIGPDPEHEEYWVHLTPNRMVWESVDPAQAGSDEDPLSMPWNEIIELQPARGLRIVDELPGVEDHMMIVIASSPRLQVAMEMLIFTAEPVDDASPLVRAEHSDAFFQIVEDLLVDAFDS